jgi:uncharacterized protein (TIRG00374 family)
MADSATRHSSTCRWLVRGVCASGLVLALFFVVPTQDVVVALKQVSLVDIGILIAISLSLISVSVWKWRLFLARLGIDSAFNKLFSLYLLGYFVNVFTPSFIGGDVVRSLALGSHVNRSHAVSATILERYTGVVAMLVMALCACCVARGVTQEIVLVVIAAGLGCIVATWMIVAGWLMRLAKVVRLPQSVAGIIERIHEGFVWGVSDRKLVVKAFVLSVVFHLLTIVNTAAVGAAVGWSDIPWDGLLVVVPLILIIGAVPISPQGLGIQEGAFVFFLHSIGATTGQALAIALVLRAKSYLLALCGGLVWLVSRDIVTSRVNSSSRHSP